MPASATRRNTARLGYVAAAFAAVTVFYWTLRTQVAAQSPGRGLGLTFGVVAAAAFALPMLYPLRRRTMAWPLRDAKDWWRLHVVLGGLALPSALLHQGLRLPAGWLGWLLLGLGVWSTIFGALAVLLQRRLPGRLAAASEEIPSGRIDDVAKVLLQAADRLGEGASDAFARWYRRDVRPMLVGIHRSWRHVVRIARTPEPNLAVLPTLAPDDADRIGELLTIVARKRALDARASIQATLKFGVLVHVPAATLLVALIAFHIFVVWYL